MAPVYLAFCVVLSLLSGLSSLTAVDGGLAVGSFNIQVFGPAKFSKENVVEVLCRVSSLSIAT